MTQDFDVSLDNCDQEPIHIPGSVQPHGMLLVIDPAEMAVRFFSENLCEVTGLEREAIVGMPLAELLDARFVAMLEKRTRQKNFQFINPQPVQLDSRIAGNDEYLACISRSEGLLMVELEKAPPQTGAGSDAVNLLIKSSLHRLVSSRELEAVFDVAVKEIRKLTRFDRVMLYQFDEEQNGEVVAEARRPSLNSFLRQHFPESDIPRQARELYLRNPIRILADVDAVPSRLYPADRTLDLSTCILRSVSPIHCQYLRNMGVKASMSISIIIGGKLWGLVACHHYAPFNVPPDVREMALYMGLMLSYLISMKNQHNTAMQAARLMSITADLTEKMADAVDFTEVLREQTHLLLEMVNADGVAWRLDDRIESFGVTPPVDRIDDIFNWLKKKKLTSRSIYHTNHLGNENPAFLDFSEEASGVLALPFSASSRAFFMWFRREVIQTKNWGGKPEKVIEFLDDGSHRLMPRRSFELWKENVRHKSLWWREEETSSGLKFRNLLINYQLSGSERLQRQNEALELEVRKRTLALEEEIRIRKQAEAELQEALERSETTNRELEMFAYIASHDLQEPLRKIQLFGDRIASSGEELGERSRGFLDRIISAAERMQLLIRDVLSFSRVGYRISDLELFDLNAVIDEITDDLQVSIDEAGARIEVDELGQIYGDRAQIERLFQNLLQNALKYSAKGEEPRIRISLSESKQPGWSEVEVRDNGIGFDAALSEKIFDLFQRLHEKDAYSGTGLGLALCRKIVERHGGKIRAESGPGEGASFFVSLRSGEPSADR